MCCQQSQLNANLAAHTDIGYETFGVRFSTSKVFFLTLCAMEKGVAYERFLQNVKRAGVRTI